MSTEINRWRKAKRPNEGGSGGLQQHANEEEDEDLEAIDPRSLNQARDALILSANRGRRLMQENEELRANLEESQTQFRRALEKLSSKEKTVEALEAARELYTSKGAEAVKERGRAEKEKQRADEAEANTRQEKTSAQREKAYAEKTHASILATVVARCEAAERNFGAAREAAAVAISTSHKLREKVADDDANYANGRNSLHARALRAEAAENVANEAHSRGVVEIARQKSEMEKYRMAVHEAHSEIAKLQSDNTEKHETIAHLRLQLQLKKAELEQTLHDLTEEVRKGLKMGVDARAATENAARSLERCKEANDTIHALSRSMASVEGLMSAMKVVVLQHNKN
jgi:chromosome segregation ATPase